MSTPWKVFDHNGNHRISASLALDAAQFIVAAASAGWTVRWRGHGRDTRVWTSGKETYDKSSPDVIASILLARSEIYEQERKARADKSYAAFQAEMAKPQDPILIERAETVGRNVMVERIKKDYGET